MDVRILLGRGVLAVPGSLAAEAGLVDSAIFFIPNFLLDFRHSFFSYELVIL